VGINGTALPTGALLYWDAPQRAGIVTMSARLKDDNGSIVDVSKRIEVVAAAAPEASPGALRLRAWKVIPAYRKDGVVTPARDVEAHDVFTWDDVHFEANLQNPDYRYEWSVNGKVEPSPDIKHYFGIRPDKEAVYRVAVKVWDGAGRPLGSAEWTVRAKNLVPVYEN
jgi:hypothetical protein